MATNYDLIDYGIHNELSDIRLHVCVAVRRVYVYQTRAAIHIIESGDYETRPAYTGNVITANGYLIPPENIPTCHEYTLKKDIWEQANFRHDMSTSEKGAAAVMVAREGYECGLIGLPATVKEVTNKKIQLEGGDILVTANARVQVKCDWRGGRSELGGTGNLYLQIAERNLHNQY